DAGDAMDVLAQHAAGEHEAAALNCAIALSTMGPAGAARLGDLLRSADDRTRLFAAWALPWAGAAAQAVLQDAIVNADPAVRVAAALALGECDADRAADG